jgi:hypothetical protein
MKQIDFDQLSLHDLAGNKIDLATLFNNYLLLIFLRHLA